MIAKHRVGVHLGLLKLRCLIIGSCFITGSEYAHFTGSIVVWHPHAPCIFRTVRGLALSLALLLDLALPCLSDLVCQSFLSVDQSVGAIEGEHLLVTFLKFSVHLRKYLALLAFGPDICLVCLVQVSSLLVKQVSFLLLCHLQAFFDLAQHILLLPLCIVFVMLFTFAVCE